MSLDAKIPQIESDPDGKPTKLIWLARPEDTSIEVEQIGRYRERGIYRVLYRRHGEAAQSLKQQFAWIMFGYQEITANGTEIRPFFVANGEQIRWLESFFAASKDQPFTLEIHKTMQGNGVFWTNYSFAFTQGEPRLTKRSEGGRRMDAMTYRYGKSGKIISTETSKSQ